MARDHCSDDLLIAFLDGELPLEERRRVERHLELCWRCRPRAAEIEEQIRKVTEIFAETEHLVESDDPERRQRLLDRCRSARIQTSPTPGARVARPYRLPIASLATAGALALASVTTWVAVSRPDVGQQTKPRQLVAAPASAFPSVAPPAAPPQPLNPAPPETRLLPDLEEVEAETRLALYRLQLDIEDPPEIGQQEGMVVLRGLWREETRALLEEALAAIKHPECVRLEPYAPAAPAPAPSTVISTSQGLPPTQPFESDLLARVGGPARLLTTGNAAVALCERILDLAWALRRLEARYPPDIRVRMAAGPLGIINTIEAGYLTSLRDGMQQLTVALEPLSLPQESPAAAADTSLFESAHALRDLLLWLFAGRPLSSQPASLNEAGQSISHHLSGLETRVSARLASLQP